MSLKVRTKNKVNQKNNKADDFLPVKRSNRSRTQKMFTDSELYAEYIKTRAYYLWVERGQPLGKDWDIWLDAEQDILCQLGRKKQV